MAGRELARLIELTHPDVEWHSFLGQLGDGGLYKGHHGMRQYVRDLADAWERFSLEIVGAVEVGDIVLLVGDLRARGKGSGVETELQAGYMIKFRDGQVVRMRAFRDPEQAFEAVGLRE